METVYLCRHQNYKNQCLETFRTKEEEEIHYFKIHGISCKYCEYGTISHEAYERHLKYVHDKPLLLSCKICNESIDGLNEMEKHLEFSHNTNHWTLSLGLRELNRMIEDMK